ncbi:agmatinase [Aureimonas altamirensis]|uniref:agmatinase n=1 Tax=Aureimonas altamirensis TaxID=370622 RepID=UPI001E52A0D5|nr:agmatinase [Aureimonas altamirensis]UHD44553.1 agmatinase [Aureimonas altamirensis]
MTSRPAAAAANLGPQTFMDLPFATDAAGAKLAILGCPFDCGIHPFRVGSRQGPSAIRQQSGLIRRYHPELADFDVPASLSAVDCGDVALTPARMEDSFDAIETAAYAIIETGAVCVGLGGDGSVSLPLLRAASRAYPGLAVIHVDSHTDAYPPNETYPFDASTQFTHAALEQRVGPGSSYHLGLRGTTMVQGVHNYGRDLGYNLITLAEFLQRGQTDIVDHIRAGIGDRPVYLSWDMDVFDPSCAPGVCTPVWGGLSAREGLSLIRAFSGLNIVGCDINTVSPPQDVNGMTAFLAAQMAYEMMLLVSARAATAR